MREWNGQDLVDEFSQLLGDTSSTFETRVLKWINDICMDISSRHDWPFLRFKGVKQTTASTEEQDLDLAQPTAPTATIASGGSLTEDSVYTVLVTYRESSSGRESIAGTASSSVTATAVNKTINLTSVPTSSDSLVNQRRIYLSKDGGTYYLYSTISDNTTTTGTITADTTDTTEPPDYGAIRKIVDNPFTTSTILTRSTVDYLRRSFQGTWSTGSMQMWAPFGDSKVVVYPPPSTATDLYFYYYKYPAMVANTSTSQPDIPIKLKQVLKAGVIAMGYEYRDRDGLVEKRNIYEQLLKDAISTMGADVSGAFRVRDVEISSGDYNIG